MLYMGGWLWSFLGEVDKGALTGHLREKGFFYRWHHLMAFIVSFTVLIIVIHFVSRVGQVSEFADLASVELVWFDKEFLFLLLQTSCCR